MPTRTRGWGRTTQATADTTTTPRVDRAGEVERPTRRQVISAIVAEAGCTREGAHETIEMLRRAVDYCRANPGQPYYISQAYLDRWHDIFSTVIPGRTRDVQPGSARALLNRYLLTAGELNILHTSNYARGVTHCTVHVTVNVV